MFASCGREAIMVGMDCPDCSGTGKITLFTSAKPCKACGGTGKVAGKEDATEQCWATLAVTYDPIKGVRYVVCDAPEEPS
jgi:RecJ-like exonuclease